MNKEEFKDLLTRYLAGSCSDEERLLVEGLYDILGKDKHLVPEDLDSLGEDIWQRIQTKTQLEKTGEPKTRIKFIPQKVWYKRTSWQIAASIVLLLGVGIIWLQLQRNQLNISELLFADRSTHINNESSPQVVWLDDSTQVRLFPKSRLNIPIAFNDQNKREVFLTGVAVFDVTKNPHKPFLVHTGEVTTQVIGTKFKIKNTGKKENLEVAVLSGKVSVYNQALDQAKEKVSNGVVLTPNQKVTYHHDNQQFVTAIVDEPILLDTSEEESVFIYDDSPIETVLEQLETSYGIQIEVVDNERFHNCPLTADLSRQSLYNKLEMICTSLNASYEVKGTTILITGSGCN